MTASAPSQADLTKLLIAEPQLFVTDIGRALGFYTGTLGFETVFTSGDPPFYAQVRREGARFNIRHVDEPIFDTELAAREDFLAVTIVVDHIKPLFLEYKEAGAPFHQQLRTERWGARTFIIRDPDGNLIAFAADSD